MSRKALILFTALITMAGCKAQQPMGEEIDGLVLLERDAYGPGEEFEARAIRDQKQLAHFYSLVNRTRKPGLPLPEIDFERELVLLIQLGTRQGEKTLLVSQIGETDLERTLAVEILDPPDGENPSRAIQRPFYLYKIPYTDKTLLFERIEP